MTDPDSGEPINPIARAISEANGGVGSGNHDLAPPGEGPIQPSPPHPSQGEPNVVYVEQKKRGMGCFGMIAACVLILTVGVVAVYYLTAQGVWRFGQSIANISENFLNENITQTFIAAHMEPESSSKLETATAEVRETFTDTRNWRVFNMDVAGSSIDTTLNVNATYRYHVTLDGCWELSQVGSTCVVVAPPISPTLPVAFDSGKQEWNIKTSSWLRNFDSNSGRRRLETTITEKLEERAGSEEALQKAREPSRVSIANFIKNWLKSEEQWRQGGFTEIKVLFPEEAEHMHPDQLPATVVLERENILKVPLLE
tara:strand:+ start:1641 stop:2579 length:939 start_codon:yes stop_codon:yes gene_type:complete